VAEIPKVLRAVFSPADEVAGSADVLPLLQRSWQCQWGEGPAVAWQLTAHEKAALATFLSKLHRGAALWADMHDAAPILARGLPVPDELLSLGSAPWVELEVRSAEDERMLTELPWEVAAATRDQLPLADQPLLAHLVGRLPIVRVSTAGKALTTSLPFRPFRPSVLWCVSSPSRMDEIDLAGFDSICRRTFDQFPFLRAESLGALGKKPLWSAVVPEILRRRPNIFVLVAHGDSRASGSDPAVYFQDPCTLVGGQRVPVRELAAVLHDAGTVWMTILICCDLVRASAYSAALELVRCGIPEVVAMQGKIKEGTAQSFLEGFLGDLLVRHSTAVAAAAGRVAAKDDPHACLPALFTSAAQRERPNPLIEIAAAYDVARNGLAARALAVSPYLERPGTDDRPLERALINALAATGLLVIKSALGDGGTELVKACVRRASLPENRGSSRPVVYLDVGNIPVGELTSTAVADMLGRELRSESVLLPLGVTASDSATTARKFLELVNVSRVSVVIDHVPAPTSADEEFWKDLIEQAEALCPQGLICIMPRGLDVDKLLPAAKDFTVLPFDLAETTAYVNEHLEGVDSMRLFEHTGGKPLFLEAARRRRLKNPKSDVMLGFEERTTIARYLSILKPVLSARATRVMFEVACLDGAASRNAVIEHIVGPESEFALDELIRSGIAGPVWLAAEGPTGVSMPVWTRDAIRAAHRVALRNARLRIAKRFRNRSEVEQETAVRALALTYGGSTVIECIQRALADAGDWGLAVMVALYADVEGASDSAVLSAYDAAIDIMKQSRETPYPELVLGAISRVQNLGRNHRVEELLKELMDEPAPFEQAQVEAVRAIWLKDTAQTGRLAEIEESFRRALELTDGPHDPDGPKPEEWAELRQRILLNSLQARLFLVGETYVTVPERYRRLVNEMSESPDKAVLLCTFAEQEMRQPPERIDWARVAEWVVGADAMLDQGGDDRAKTYCAYQYGQYLRARSTADDGRAAHERYAKADEAGQRSTEVRRWGLARLRRVELLLENPTLEGDDGDASPRARELLDEVLSGFPLDRGDALAARARGLLCALRANLATDGTDERRVRDEAAAAFAAPMLRSASDNNRFVGQVVLLLGKALDDPRTGDFRYAQQLLFRFRERLEGLGLTVDIEAPSAVLAGLRSIIENEREFGILES